MNIGLRVPCKKVRVGGFLGFVGITSPSRVFLCCTQCDKPCKWFDKNIHIPRKVKER